MTPTWALLIFLAILAVGLYWLIQALVTGRARFKYMTADRATHPVRYWMNVSGLALFVVVAALGGVSQALRLVSQAVSHGVLGHTFHARHQLVADRDAPASPGSSQSAAGCETPGPRICVVTVGVAPDVPVDDLARYVGALVSRPTGILAPVALARQAEGHPVIDTQRGQAGADAVERLVRVTYPVAWNDRDVTMLILTGYDLWLESRPGQQYAFGSVTVRPGGGGFAVISSARMDPGAYGLAPNPAVLERRMHVLVGKYLAFLLYGKKPSADPTSALYGNIQSPADLDHMQLFTPQ
jgi:hypothetical protein